MEVKEYIDIARTEEEMEKKCLDYLLQLAPKDKTFETKSDKTLADGQPWKYRVSLLSDGGEGYFPDELYKKLPTVFSCHNGDKYLIYFLPDFDRLPYYYKYLADPPAFLPIFKPLQRPEAMVTAMEAHTPEGRRKIDSFFAYGSDYDREAALRHVRRLVEYPDDMKIYALLDDFGELTPRQLKRQVDSGEYDGAWGDGEYFLSLITGERYDTEEKYLSGLSEICGSKAVKKYKDVLVEKYGLYHLVYYSRLLEYRLRKYENFQELQKEEKDLRNEYGVIDKYSSKIYEEGLILDMPLKEYLHDFVTREVYLEGLSLVRLADYIGAPMETVRRVIPKIKR